MNDINYQNEEHMGKIALFGAAGGTGKSISAELARRAIPYRVVGRDIKKLAGTFGHDNLAEIVTWNPDEPQSVIDAATGVDTIVYLVGIRYDQFELHPVLMQKTLEGAIAAGVKRIVLVGTVYPYGTPQTPLVAETHPRNPRAKNAILRKKQEDILLTAHAEGKIRATILRLPDFYGFDAGPLSYLHLMFAAAVNGTTADMIGPIDLPHEFVYMPDIGPAVLDLAAKPEAYGTWWHFAGSGPTTQRSMAERAFELAGAKPRLRVLGKPVMQLLGLFNPIMRELASMNYLFTTPLLMDDHALTALLGPLKKTSYDEGIRLTLEAYAAAKK